VLQQRQFRQLFLRLALAWRMRIFFQEFLVGLRCQGAIAQLISLQLANAQQSILAVLAPRIFVYEKQVGIDCRLVVTPPEAISHLRIKFGDGEQGIHHFGRSRRNQVDAPITGNNRLVFRQRALLRRLAI
jgi:hypothetical protein